MKEVIGGMVFGILLLLISCHRDEMAEIERQGRECRKMQIELTTILAKRNRVHLYWNDSYVITNIVEEL